MFVFIIKGCNSFLILSEVIEEFKILLDKSGIKESLKSIQEIGLKDSFIRTLAGMNGSNPELTISEMIALVTKVHRSESRYACDENSRKNYQASEEELPEICELKLYLIAFQKIFGSSINSDQIFMITYMLFDYFPKYLTEERKSSRITSLKNRLFTWREK